ncbi:MAG: hypothetical protein NZ700_07940 [Gemmataceae bacterium]|nr:hypothetical protein [Gemmataceae bacterium]MDW8265934.1 hypothetical protein [Gemmataceae bacterium]
MSQTCPYCSALIPPTETAPGLRECPRCRAYLAEGQGEASIPAEGAAAAGAAAPAMPRRWSNAAVAAAVLAVMGGMATLSLTFAFVTVEVRRAYDRERPERRVPIDVTIARIPPLVHLVRLVYVGALVGYLVRRWRRPAPGRSGLAQAGIAVAVLLLGSLALYDAVSMVGKWVGVMPGDRG